MLPFQTPIPVSRFSTFPLLAHPISKSLSHPDLALSAPTFQDLLFCFGSLPLLFLFFSFLAIPSQSCRYNLPGLGHCPYPVVRDQARVLISAFPLSLPWGLGSLLLLRPRKFKYVEEDSEL